MKSLFHRIYGALLATSLMAVVLAAIVSAFVFYESSINDGHADLERGCGLVVSALEEQDNLLKKLPLSENKTEFIDEETRLLSGLDLGGARITLIAADGTVLYDNEFDAADLPNHADRPEVAQALKQGFASSERASDTAGYVSLYHAKRMRDGRVVRLAEDEANVSRFLTQDVVPLGVVFAVLAVACIVAARLFSRWLTRPILAMDLGDLKAGSPYRELEPLTQRLSDQQDEIHQQLQELREAAEIRQQYSSNVTHELKTPIASISGAAELVESGLVPPEDIPGFAHRIRGDADRLLVLVNDILTLSRLDESERSGDLSLLGTAEPCDLYSIAADVLVRLEASAESKGVSLSLKGSSVIIQGYPRLLDELINNLIANAIRYNRPEGSVSVSCGVTRSDANETQHGDAQVIPFITVADTGIGIPAEDTQKIFARFYRVDTSRARETGGTGLGLAIVKHASAVHHGKISLESTVGFGTTITISFPAIS